MRVVQEIDRKKWSNFVYQHPNGNIFQTPEMYEVYRNTKNYEPVFISVLNENNEVLGILLSVIQKEYQGKFGSLTARAIIHGGPIVKDDNPKVLHFILNEYDKVIKKKVIYSQFRNLWDLKTFKYIFNDFGYIFENHLNIAIDLKKSADTLWKEIHSKRRYKIRKALKEGTSARELTSISDIEMMYAILNEVYNNAKLPIADISMFLTTFKFLGPRAMVKFFGAYNDEKLIGTICVLVYRKTLYDWYAGSLREYYNKYPNDLLPWEVFKWGKENGYTLFDFGGAGRPDKKYGVRDFKKKFGGKLLNYGRFEKIHRPMKHRMAMIGFKLWQKIKR